MVVQLLTYYAAAVTSDTHHNQEKAPSALQLLPTI